MIRRSRALHPISFTFSLSLFLSAMVLPSAAISEDLSASVNLCTAKLGEFNQRFTTVKGLDGNGNIADDSGLIVHTIHGPGPGPTELDLAALGKLPVNATKTCGAYMSDQQNPVFLPWCGSNHAPKTGALSDASSWTFIRHDTLLHGPVIQRPDEVVCAAANNKRYGLIFANTYMNENDNLGCMYPLDGDTGNRTGRGCGITANPAFSQKIIQTEAQGKCPLGDTASAYLKDFNALLNHDNHAIASIAGSLICSLPKQKFDLWVAVRQQVNLRYTSWPVNEFVLWNWDGYSTQDLAGKGYLIGIYYLTGCAETPIDGTRAEAQAIADLYEKWSGVALPVVNLSNAEMRKKGTKPFSCQ